MRMTRLYLGIALMASAMLAGCEKSTETPARIAAKKDVRVLETFNVGDDVYVRSLAVDSKQGALWVGTSLGVHEVDLTSRNTRNTFTRAEGLANEYVFAIFIDREGYKWFGTNGGGVTRYRNGEWKTYFPMHGLADYWVYAFNEQADGTLWIGTWAGANRYNKKTGEFATYLKELVNEWVYAVAVDPQQRVWLGTEGGISMFDGQAWHAWTHNDGLGAPNTGNLPLSTNTGLGTRTRHDLNVQVSGSETYNPNYVFCLHVDPKGQVWAGTWGGGVSRFDGRQWTNYTVKDGLASNIVYSIAQDASGTLWFGTHQGLTRYDGRRWQTFTRNEGLIDNDVYAIAAVPGGDVWVGTKGGVARIGR
jgi:ligand-binding sensor domain-containing protein